MSIAEIEVELDTTTLEEINNLPKDVLIAGAVEAGRKLMGKAYQELKDSTQTWSHSVNFVMTENISDTEAEFTIGTDDLIFHYVDAGTPPHDIIAKNAPMLVFQVGYKAKTIPGVLGSINGGKFGAIRRAKKVHHPGTEARGFADTAMQEVDEKLDKTLLEAIRREWNKK